MKARQARRAVVVQFPGTRRVRNRASVTGGAALRDSPFIQMMRELERESPQHAAVIETLADGILEKLPDADRRTR